MKHAILFIPLMIFVWGCTNNANKIDMQKISETQRQREICLDWYGYRIDIKKAINDLNLKIETESELMTYCDFLKNVVDTNSAFFISVIYRSYFISNFSAFLNI